MLSSNGRASKQWERNVVSTSKQNPAGILASSPVLRRCWSLLTANFPTNIVDFRGFDSSIILILRGGIPRPIVDFPESLSQAMLAGIMLVGGLGVCDELRADTTQWPETIWVMFGLCEKKTPPEMREHDNINKKTCSSGLLARSDSHGAQPGSWNVYLTTYNY